MQKKNNTTNTTQVDLVIETKGNAENNQHVSTIAVHENPTTTNVGTVLCLLLKHACTHAPSSLSGSIVTTIFHSLMEITWPFLLSTAIDENSKKEGLHHTHGLSKADTFTLLFATAWTLGQLAYYARSNAITRLTATITQTSSSEVMNRIMQLSYPDWKKNASNVETMSEYQNNIEKIVNSVFVTLPSAVEIGIDAVLVSLYCGTWAYAVSIPFGTLGIGFLTFVLSQYLVQKKVEEATKQNAEATTAIANILQSYPLNKLEDMPVEEKINQYLQDAKNAYIRMSTWADSVLALQNLLAGLGFTALLLYTSYLVQESDKSDENRFVADDIVYVTNYLIAIAMNLYTLGNHSKEIRVALTGLKRSFTILQTQAEDTRSGTDFPLDERGMAIVCQDVTIKNPKGFKFMRNLSFTLNPGQLTGLVGLSGGGKSNITRLLLGFFRSAEYSYTGSLTYNGIELRAISLSSLRRGIVTTSQEFQVDNTKTLRENLTMGLPGTISDEYLTNLLHYFDLTDKKLDLPVHDFSGGQKQRVSMMRAILKGLNKNLEGKTLYIFDEATSAQDNKRQAAMMKIIAKLKEHGATILFIAHRLRTLMNAEQIIFLNSNEEEIEGKTYAYGTIDAIGTHNELMETCAGYKALFDLENSEPLTAEENQSLTKLFTEYDTNVNREETNQHAPVPSFNPNAAVRNTRVSKTKGTLFNQQEPDATTSLLSKRDSHPAKWCTIM